MSWSWGQTIGAVLGAVAFCHWLLDLPMHHRDMPVLPGNMAQLPLFGFGLWSVPAAAASLELLLVGVGTWLYWKREIVTVRPEITFWRED